MQFVVDVYSSRSVATCPCLAAGEVWVDSTSSVVCQRHRSSLARTSTDSGLYGIKYCIVLYCVVLCGIVSSPARTADRVCRARRRVNVRFRLCSTARHL